MPRHKEGYTQLATEMPDELLAAMRVAASDAGLTLTAWISTVCAAELGVEYTPPKLGRPAAEPDPPPPRARKGKPTPPPPSPKRRGRRKAGDV